MKEYENNIEDQIKAKIKTKVDDPVPYLEGIEDDVKLLQTKAKNNLLVTISNHIKARDQFGQSLIDLSDKLKTVNQKLANPKVDEYIKSLDNFIGMAKVFDGGEVSDAMGNNFFNGKDGVRDIVIGLKNITDEDGIYDEIGDDYKEVIELFDGVIWQSMNAYEKNEYLSTKYVAANYGDFNLGVDDELADGISKVAVAYSWMKSNARVKVGAPDNETGFNIAEMDKKAKQFRKKNEIFLKEYKDNNLGNLDVDKLKETVENRSEWKILNLMQMQLEEKRAREEELKALAEEVKKSKEQEKSLKEKNSDLKAFADKAMSLNGKPPKRSDSVGAVDYKEFYTDEFYRVSEEGVLDYIDNAVSNLQGKKEEKKVDLDKDEDNKYAPEDADLKYRYVSKRERREIQEREFQYDFDEIKLSELKPAEQAYVHAVTINLMFKNLSSVIKSYIIAFHGAQVDKKANKPGSDKKEGPEDYRNILDNLYKIKAIIDNDNPKMGLDDLGKEINGCFDKINQYIKDHKPRVRGHRTAESAKRYEEMEKLAKGKPIYVTAINTLFNNAKDNMKAIKGAPLKLGEVSVNDLSDKMSEVYAITNTAELNDKAVINAQYQHYQARREVLTKRILENLKKMNSDLDVYGVYESMDWRMDKDSIEDRNPDEKKLRSTAFANARDINEVGVVMRELLRLKSHDTTIMELEEMELNSRNGGLAKEVDYLTKSNGYMLNMEVGRIIGIDKLKNTESNAMTIARNRTRMSEISEEIHNSTPDELKKGVFFIHKDNLTDWVAYNVLITNILKKPENTGILANVMAIKCPFNGKHGINCNYAWNKVLKTCNDYLKKTGIINEMKAEGKTSFEHLPELIKKVEDPKFENAFKKVFSNACAAQRRKYQEEILYTAGQAKKKYDRENAPEIAAEKRRLKEVAKEEKAEKEAAKKEAAKNKKTAKPKGRGR